MRPDTSVIEKPSRKAREYADAIAPEPDRFSTPRPSSAPTMSETTQRFPPVSSSFIVARTAPGERATMAW